MLRNLVIKLLIKVTVITNYFKDGYDVSLLTEYTVVSIKVQFGSLYASPLELNKDLWKL